METGYGEDSIETISENILIGLGCNTEANHVYLAIRLEELVGYVTELCAEKTVKNALLGKIASIEDDRDTIEL